MAKAYLITRTRLVDVSKYQNLRPVYDRLARAFGGVILARSDAVRVLEGEPPGGMLSVYEFPDEAALHKALSTPEYAEVRTLLQGAVHADMWIVTGV